MPSAALLLASAAPNEDALVRAPIAGWLMLAAAFLLAMIFIVQREGWRRLWLQAEDPRSMALFRIVFGLCVMCNINGLWELYPYLFTDEGLFLTDVARQVFAREQFLGFGSGLGGDRYGFFDGAAILQFLAGPKFSLLFFWDSPVAFWCHWAAFQAAIVAFIVGWKTTYSKWLAWFLFHSIIQRNAVFWEGTETVFRVFFFYLCLSRCGHAYSIDNWLRCRRLRRQGRLSERGLPGIGAGAPPSEEHPAGLEAVYRRIPAWPRLLIILQCGALYCATGAVKNGAAWWKGDAFYYALNLDHFYRFPPQQLSAWFGTNLMRLSTHVVHAWECLFPLVILGLIVRFGLREHLPAKGRFERAVHAAAWIALGLVTATLCVWLLPVHYEPAPRSFWTTPRVQWLFAMTWAGGMFGLVWLVYRLRHQPFAFTLRRRQIVIDLPRFLRWMLGRRVWLFVGIVFHLHLMVLMNIGWFQPAALSVFIAFLNGGEVALALTLVGRRLGRLRVPWIPPATLRGLSPLPAEDPRLLHLHHDGVRMPTAAMLVGVVAAASGVVLTGLGLVRFGWVLAGVVVFLFLAQLWAIWVTPTSKTTTIVRRPFSATTPMDASAPWAYGPLGRFLANMLVIYHLVGVASWLLPDKDSFAWRRDVQAPFAWWLRITQTTQGWGMFAPNPPRSNRFLKVLVTDGRGEVWDMKTDVYALENFGLPTLGYTRQRKINRRITGAEGGSGAWYQKWHARWYCRAWTLEHGGDVAESVELRSMTYPIPTPEWTRTHGPYDPVERREDLGRETLIHRADCRNDPDAQLPDRIRKRHGLDPSPIPVHRWKALFHREMAWSRRHESHE